MTDSISNQLSLSREDDNSETPEASSSTLRFPQLLLETSFDSLLSHSYQPNPTTSNHMEAPQRGPGSLSESWASISDAEYSLDDDLQSEHTDLGSLIDIHSTGDIQSVRDDEVSSEADHDDQEENIDEQQASAIRIPLLTQTKAPPSLEASVTDDGQLILDEQSDIADGGASVATKTLKKFSPAELRMWKMPAEQGYVGRVHMPLGKEFIKDSGRQTFKALLFRSKNASELTAVILHKLADAQLAVGSEVDSTTPRTPSRYHVLPDTFGPGSQPAAAAIVPVDYQLETVHYETAEFGADPQGTIRLGDRDIRARTTSIWDPVSARYIIGGAQMKDPDLAIVVTDNLGEAGNREFARASLAFARRHGIPAIAIRIHEDWIADPALGGFIEDGIHLKVESETTPDSPVIRTLPIDMDMFLNLNPSQLSRHVRLLMQRSGMSANLAPVGSQTSEQEHTDLEKNAEPGRKIQRSPQTRFGLGFQLERLMHFLIFLVCGMILAHGLAAIKTKWELSRISTIDGMPGSTQTSSQTLSTLTTSLTLSNDVAVATAVPSPPSASPLASRKRFQVEIVGNSHLVVRTAREYRVQDKLGVSITRQGKPIHADIRVLFPSVWSIRLEAEQAYGDLCVQLSLKRPAINETVEVNLGQQPLDAWFKNLLDETEGKIQQKLALLQDSLESLQRQERPQNLVKNVQARFSQLMQQADQILKSQDVQARASNFKKTLQQHRATVTESANLYADRLATELQALARISSSNSRVLARQMSKGVDRMRLAIGELHLKEQVDTIWQSVREGPQSEILAMAQDRAQQIVKDVREKLAKRKA